MATYSSILAWRILWTEEPEDLQAHGVAELATTERLTLLTTILLTGAKKKKKKNTRKLYGTKNNCLQAQLGQFLDAEDTK